MSDEKPEALLKSALEKIVYFEARSTQLSNDAGSSRSELDRVKGDLAAASQRDTDNLTHRKVQAAIENFASSLLTQRERQVLFYLISGYSSALTAQRLSTTEGTIKIHRRNIYRKLDIGSQAELFSLFINCIQFALPGAPFDPLKTYQSVPAAARLPSVLGVLSARD